MAFNYDPTIANTEANEEEQYAQQNNNFWKDQYDKFNPQQTVLQNQQTGAAYQNIANQAKDLAGQSRSVAGGSGGGGGMDYGQLGRNLDTEGQSTSRTEDLNSFINNMNGNHNLANDRLKSMFGGAAGVNEKERYMSEGLPLEAGMKNAENRQQIENAWNKYYSGQPNFGNEIGAGVGKLGGLIVGKNLSSLFG